MSSPKIVFVNRFFAPDQSATSQMLSSLAFHLAGKGMHVSVITSRGRYDDPSSDLPCFEKLNDVKIHRVCKPRFGRATLLGRAADYLAMYRAFAAAASRLAGPADVLVVKTDPPLLSVALAPVARRNGAHLVNWLQDLYPEVALGLGMRMLAPFAPALVAARNASLKSACRNVAIGERMSARIEALGVAPERIDTIPNWCDDDIIVPRPIGDNPLRSAWSLEAKFVVGYSGNLGRAHEYATLLGAAERLRDHADIVFLFIGGGHFTGTLRAEIDRRGLAGMFQFRPYQDASLLPVSLSVPDIHWISLRPAMEGLIVPSKFYAAAAVGRATIVVGEADGEIGALVRRHECGAAIGPGDEKGLADLILAMKTNPARLGQMGRNARRMLDQRFRKQDSLRRWEVLIENLWGRELHIEQAARLTWGDANERGQL